jgi:hypothetical protein
MRILYGGSVKAENATALMSQPEIDGRAGRGREFGPKVVCGDCELVGTPFILVTQW